MLKKPLREISRDIVLSTWREVNFYNSSMLARLTERLETKQPCMLPFVLKISASEGPEAQQLATYLGHMIFRMEEKVKGENMKAAPEEVLVALHRQNEAWVEGHSEFTVDLIQDSIKKGEEIRQPQLQQYILEVLFEELEGGGTLKQEMKKKLFIILKSLIDAYEIGVEGR